MLDDILHNWAIKVVCPFSSEPTNESELRQVKNLMTWGIKLLTEAGLYSEEREFSTPVLEAALELVRAERLRQDQKWGANRDLDDSLWLTILTEEIGEVAKAMLERSEPDVLKELVQVAAVSVVWIENIISNRRKSNG